MPAKSNLLDFEKDSLNVKRDKLVSELEEAEKDHKEKEKKSQAANRVSMNSYYKVKELKDAIEKIDEAIKVLDTVEKDRW